MTFTRTQEAAKADKQSKWQLISAIAEDAIDNGMEIVSAPAVLEAKAALDAAGHEHADGTVRNLCMVAKFDFESNSAQRRVWRRYGWSVIVEVAQAGWSQEAAQSLLMGDRKSWRDVRAAVQKKAAPSHGAMTGVTDARVITAAQLLVDARRQRAEGTYEPGGEAALMLDTMFPQQVDWDAELASLTQA